METVKVLMKALANDTRLEIVRMLLGKPMCVHALARHFQVSEPTICVHIRVLREAGLVSGERKGYFVHYKANLEIIQELASQFADLSTPKQVASQKCHCHEEGHCQCHAKEKHKNETSSKKRR
ncbi:MAG: winged helix-turn-helix transcriptional regulator [Victivallales bacterium]|nr:winged helix-turn-helix transcriptional regulator [Victivallales bacterium]